MRAFSKKVLPSSTGSGKSPKFPSATNPKPSMAGAAPKIASISASLCALPVATTTVRLGSNTPIIHAPCLCKVGDFSLQLNQLFDSLLTEVEQLV